MIVRRALGDKKAKVSDSFSRLLPKRKDPNKSFIGSSFETLKANFMMRNAALEAERKAKNG